MIPAALLAIEPHHAVLDLCAAPGRRAPPRPRPHNSLPPLPPALATQTLFQLGTARPRKSPPGILRNGVLEKTGKSTLRTQARAPKAVGKAVVYTLIAPRKCHDSDGSLTITTLKCP